MPEADYTIFTLPVACVGRKHVISRVNTRVTPDKDTLCVALSDAYIVFLHPNHLRPTIHIKVAQVCCIPMPCSPVDTLRHSTKIFVSLLYVIACYFNRCPFDPFPLKPTKTARMLKMSSANTFCLIKKKNY